MELEPPSTEKGKILKVHFRDLRGDIVDVDLPAETHGKHIYRELRNLSPSLMYLLRKSRARRLAMSEGEEWVGLRQAGKWSTAWLTTRLFLEGFPGIANRRPSHLRGLVSCWGCVAFGNPRWRWLSPSEGTDEVTTNGVAWCNVCCQISLPATVLGRVESGDEQTNNMEILPGPPVPNQGPYTSCPFCGSGEAGTEHLVVFCQAAHRAWRALCPTFSHWWMGWLTPDGASGCAQA